jgi:hypothetical protein
MVFFVGGQAPCPPWFGSLEPSYVLSRRSETSLRSLDETSYDLLPGAPATQSPVAIVAERL